VGKTYTMDREVQDFAERLAWAGPKGGAEKVADLVIFLEKRGRLNRYEIVAAVDAMWEEVGRQVVLDASDEDHSCCYAPDAPCRACGES
jgi:hypothetical protein